MYPDRYITPEENDSIAQAHLRADRILADHLEQQNRVNRFATDPERFVRMLAKERKGFTVLVMLKAFRYWYGVRRWFTKERYLPGRQELVAELHHRVLLQDQFLCESGVLDIVQRVVDSRCEQMHLLVDEAVLKIQELKIISAEVDEKLGVYDRRINLFERMCDAIPAEYKQDLEEQIETIRKVA